MNDNQVLLSIKGVSKSYQGHQVIQDISMSIHQGEVISIIGPSGSGKSTLLRMLNLLEVPSQGEIYWKNHKVPSKGKSLDKYRRKVGMVFQQFHLFPHKTVLENLVLAPVHLKQMTREEGEKKALELLERIGLKEKANAYPFALSGGQKQRVAILRALMMEPEVLLFDEPTSALDPEMVKEVLMLIEDLAKEGMTMVIVTHEMGFAQKVSTRVLFLEEGKVIQDDTPQNIFEHPDSPRLQMFLDSFL